MNEKFEQNEREKLNKTNVRKSVFSLSLMTTIQSIKDIESRI